MDSFIAFLNFIYPDILLVIGTLGNFLSFLVFSRKRFNKMRINLSFRAHHHHQSTANEVGMQASTILFHPWRFLAADRMSSIVGGVSLSMSWPM